MDGAGNLYIADTYNHRIRKVDADTGNISTVAGSGTPGFGGDGGAATEATLNWPHGVAVDNAGNLHIADRNNHRIRKVDADTGSISAVAGSGSLGFGGDGGAATAARLLWPQGVALDSAGNLYIAGRFNHRIRKVDADTGSISTVAGSGEAGFGGDGGAAAAATLNYPTGVAVDSSGNLLIADTRNHRIRKVVATTGSIRTVAGTGTPGFGGDGDAAAAAMLNNPEGVAVDSAGNLYIADTYNHRVRRVYIPTAPPPPNEPPVAVGEFEDLELDPGEGADIFLSRRFRDPEGGNLSFSAESLNPDVASVAVSNGRLRVEAHSVGLATVAVTATDPNGLSAQQTFRVTVSRVLTFAEGALSAPEGGTVRLRVELSRPLEQAISLGYVLEADGDPATADMDDDDHAASDGTVTLAAGETEALIEVPILDDADIEPAREFLRVRLVAPDEEADWTWGLSSALVAVQEGVCDRSPEVRDALRGSRECWEVSVGDLAGRAYLGLLRRGIAALRPKDLLGLSGLHELHLRGNRLSSLPDGLLDGLGALERLRLDGNRLTEVPSDLRSEAPGLSVLDLGGNRLTELPADAFGGLPSLRRLRLDGNRIESLPAGLFEGLDSLSELQLQDNPGAPFTLTMALARTDADEPWAPGPASVRALVAEGAPFPMTAGLSAVGGGLSTPSLGVPTGATAGGHVSVSGAAPPPDTWEPGADPAPSGGAVLVSLDSPPPVPDALCGEAESLEGRYSCFDGVRTAVGPALLLFKRPPRVAGPVPGLTLEALDDAASVDLSSVFAGDGGDVLAYAAESSDPTLATVAVVDGFLVVTPNENGDEGELTVTVTATDDAGQSIGHSFVVTVDPAVAPFVRGWRLPLLKAPQTTAADGAAP